MSCRRLHASVTIAVALAAAAPAQNLFARRQAPTSLTADHRATAVGDILTVVIKETTRVKNEDKVNRSNTSSLAARLESFTLSDKAFKENTLPALDVRQDRQVEGAAKQEKDSALEARIAVIVIDVHPNGNLVVAGTRVVRVDDEDKTLRISGIVRPLDVAKDNTVGSSQVADARVSITGEGGNSRMVTRGPVATLVDTLIWAAWPF